MSLSKRSHSNTGILISFNGSLSTGFVAKVVELFVNLKNRFSAYTMILLCMFHHFIWKEETYMKLFGFPPFSNNFCKKHFLNKLTAETDKLSSTVMKLIWGSFLIQTFWNVLYVTYIIVICMWIYWKENIRIQNPEA